MIIGNTTEDFTIMAAGDSVYVGEYAKGLVCSCALNQNNVHIHVTNPTEKDHDYLNYLNKGYLKLYPNGKFTSSYDLIDISKLSKESRRTFYACNRFLVADKVAKGDILILDLDCYLKQHIDPLYCDVALFQREPKGENWERLGTHIAAGAVFCKYMHLDFLTETAKIITDLEMKWLADQVALYEAYLKFKDQKQFECLTSDFMDWEFKPTSKIWTGKGTSKKWSIPYTKTHDDIKRKFPTRESL